MIDKEPGNIKSRVLKLIYRLRVDKKIPAHLHVGKTTTPGPNEEKGNGRRTLMPGKAKMNDGTKVPQKVLRTYPEQARQPALRSIPRCFICFILLFSNLLREILRIRILARQAPVASVCAI